MAWAEQLRAKRLCVALLFAVGISQAAFAQADHPGPWGTPYAHGDSPFVSGRSSAFTIKLRPQSVQDTQNPPGCQNACTDQLFNAFGTTLPLNVWLEFCSFTPVPGQSYSCYQAPDYQGCLAQFCPFLLPAIAAANNQECGYCLANPLEGETTSCHILRCASAYNPADASLCLFPPSWWYWYMIPWPAPAPPRVCVV